MKRFIVAFFFALAILQIHGVTNQELFLQANNAYKNGNFKEALGLYQSLTKKGWAVWYNMGNCWHELEDYVNALIYWKKAEKVCDSSFLPTIENNCRLAYEALEISPEEKTGPEILKPNYVPLIFWQLLFLALLYLAALLAPLLIRRKRFYMLSVIMSMTVGATGMVWYQYQQRSIQSAVITKSFELVAGTDHNFTKCGKVMNGTSVTVLSQHGPWYKISEKGQLGWIPNDCVELI